MSDPQLPLIVETIEEALTATIQAMGGLKRVGAELRPELDPHAAGRWLADCLNPDRREHLTPPQLCLLRRKARQAGVHLLAAYEARDAGYADPQPLEPEDERALLQRQFIEQTKLLAKIVQRAERLEILSGSGG